MPSIPSSASDASPIWAWLSANNLTNTISADALRKHSLHSMEDFIWLFLNPSSYASALSELFPALGHRAAVHRLIADHSHTRQLMDRVALITPGVGAMSTALANAVPHNSQPSFPLVGSQMLQIYWDIECVVGAKDEVNTFVKCIKAKLLSAGIITNWANVQIHVVAKQKVLSIYAPTMKGQGYFLHPTTARRKHAKEAADRLIAELVHASLRTSTPQLIPAYMFITRDSDFSELMQHVQLASRHALLVHRALERSPVAHERLGQYVHKAWDWKEVWAARSPPPAYGSNADNDMEIFSSQADASLPPLNPSDIAASPSGSSNVSGMPLPVDFNDGLPTADCDMVRSYSSTDLPTSREAVEARLVNCPQMLLVCKALAYGRSDPARLKALFKTWGKRKMWFADETYAAFYLMRGGEKGGVCTKFNGLGYSGLSDYCNVADKYGKVCEFSHKCLFCNTPGHGWFGECPAHHAYERELETVGLSEEDFDACIDVYCGRARDRDGNSDGEAVGASASGSGEEAEDVAARPQNAAAAAAVQSGLNGIFYRDDLTALLKSSSTLLTFVSTVASVVGDSRKLQSANALLKQWKEKKVPINSIEFAAHFFEKGMRHCCRQNGPGVRVGVGYGACNHEARTGKACSYNHCCLLCGEAGHGWFDFEICQQRLLLNRELRELGLTRGDVKAMVDIYRKEGQKMELVLAKAPSPTTAAGPAAPSPSKGAAVVIGGGGNILPSSSAAQSSASSSSAAPPTPSRALPSTPKGIWEMLNDHAELTHYLRAMMYSDVSQIEKKRKHLKREGFDVTDEFSMYYRLRFAVAQKNGDPSPCINFNNGKCSFKSLKGKECPHQHACLMCEALGSHGFQKCPKYKVIEKQMGALQLTDDDVEVLAETLRAAKDRS